MADFSLPGRHYVACVLLKRTRSIGAIACALLILLLGGALAILMRPTLLWAMTLEAMGHSPHVTAAQYLPWAAGEAVHVNQGNFGPASHDRRETQYGWDFGLAPHEPVLAGVTGEVLRADGGCEVVNSVRCHGGWGNLVVVRVTDGTCARFAHLANIAVELDQDIQVGTTIGTVGSSGRSTGFHLHYQRESCATGRALPSSFVEAGVPQPGADVTSRQHVSTSSPT